MTRSAAKMIPYDVTFPATKYPTESSENATSSILRYPSRSASAPPAIGMM